MVSHNPRESDDTLGLDETRYLACIRSTEVDGSDHNPTPNPTPTPTPTPTPNLTPDPNCKQRVELSNAMATAATAGHHLTSMRWPVVMPPPAHSATRKEVPLRAFTLGVVPLDLARLGIVATVETDGRGALTLKGGRQGQG